MVLATNPASEIGAVERVEAAVAAITGPAGAEVAGTISATEAAELVGLFKILANEGRLRMLSALKAEGEVSVSALAESVGMSAQAVSNQLQRLVDRGIISARRDRNFVYYRIVDPCIAWLMDLATCLIHQRLNATSPNGCAPGGARSI